MSLTVKQRQKIRNAFESILRADYIALTDMKQLADLENYYVDIFNNVSSLLQKQDNYISGRRGTGKTTLLLRGYYECLKTISPKVSEKSEYFGDEKVLPIYIDLSNCNEIFSGNYDINFVEIHFVRQIIQSLKNQLEVMFDEKILNIFRRDNPALEDLEYIEKALVNGIKLQRDMKLMVKDSRKIHNSSEVGFEVSKDSAKVSGKLLSHEEKETNMSFSEVRGIDIQSFLNKINDIRKKAKIDNIYIFLDEFSDLNNDEQERLSLLIKKFLGSKINMYFKIGVITDRFYFGSKIIIGRDLFSLPLDLNEFVERYGGVVATIKKMQLFMEALIEKRLTMFCSEIKYDDIFRVKKEVLFNRVAREAMGVPRSIGLILQNAWIQTESSDERSSKIGLQELNYGISATRKTYFKQFQGAIKSKLIPGFYMDMWSDILDKAIIEKNRFPNRPASHFMIDPIRNEYMNILCENFLVHFLEESRTSKYGGNYNLYCIDYDICLDNNIKFAEEKDEFTSARFIYDPIITKYDGYFMKDRLKSYKCEKCGCIYEESEVCKAKVKRCFDDDTVLIEIIHKNAPKTNGNYAEVEIKILGLISILEQEDAMSAQAIADAVGCSRQKVSNWGSKVLNKKKLINILSDSDRNYYYGNDNMNRL